MGPELIVIAGIAVLLFGSAKIPQLARSVGQSLGELKKGHEQAEQELEEIRQASIDDPIETVNDGDRE